jgi:hypothetical protein
VLRIFINFSEKWTGRHFGQFLLILTKKLLGSILGHFINFDKNGLGDTLGVIINFAKKWIGRHFGRLFFPNSSGRTAPLSSFSGCQGRLILRVRKK